MQMKWNWNKFLQNYFLNFSIAFKKISLQDFHLNVCTHVFRCGAVGRSAVWADYHACAVRGTVHDRLPHGPVRRFHRAGGRRPLLPTVFGLGDVGAAARRWAHPRRAQPRLPEVAHHPGHQSLRRRHPHRRPWLLRREVLHGTLIGTDFSDSVIRINRIVQLNSFQDYYLCRN